MKRHGKLGRTAIAAIVGFGILFALAIALASRGSPSANRQASRSGSGMFEQSVSGALSAPSLAAF